MNVIYIQQVPSDHSTIVYVIEGEVITVTIGEVTDTFDFSSFPDGEVHYYEIDTALPVQPIIHAKRENGSLTVTLLDWGEGNG